jgi:uncharacterized membrane protein
MTKQEFIDRLRAALNGRIPTAQVTDTINYYEEYIITEIRKGRTESEVMDSLGDPRLIAKTIIQTSSDADGYAGSGESSGTFYQGGQYSSDSSYNTGYGNAGYGNSYNNDGYYDNSSDRRHTRLPGWLSLIIFIIIAIVVVVIIFNVLSIFAPLIIVMASVILMVKLFRDWLN